MYRQYMLDVAAYLTCECQCQLNWSHYHSFGLSLETISSFYCCFIFENVLRSHAATKIERKQMVKGKEYFIFHCKPADAKKRPLYFVSILRHASFQMKVRTKTMDCYYHRIHFLSQWNYPFVENWARKKGADQCWWYW